jgi:hypothetical protein
MSSSFHPAIDDRDVTNPVRRVVYHFSEDGAIERFVPRPAPSDPGRPPGVWAVGVEHSPLYWFPRHCPRVSVWANGRAQQELLTERFATDANRICGVETGWLDRIRVTRLFRYEFDMAEFRPENEPGHFVSIEPVTPRAVVAIDDLLGLHAAAGIELRIAPKLGSLMDQILASGLPYNFVRLRDVRR